MLPLDNYGQEAINEILSVMSEDQQKEFLAVIEQAHDKNNPTPFTLAWNSEYTPDGKYNSALIALLGELQGTSYNILAEKDGVRAYVGGQWGSGWFSVNISDPLNSGVTDWFVQD